MKEKMSLEEYRSLKKKSKSLKFRNKIIKTYDGTFQSAWEQNRWGELKMLLLSGEISELKRQVNYLLELNGIKLTTYRADFQYKDKEGRLVVEDTKSEATEKLESFRIKKALMLAIYSIDIKVVLRGHLNVKTRKNE